MDHTSICPHIYLISNSETLNRGTRWKFVETRESLEMFTESWWYGAEIVYQRSRNSYSMYCPFRCILIEGLERE